MIYLILASVIWSLVFGVTKHNLIDLNPHLVANLRCLFAAITFFPFFFKSNKKSLSFAAKKGLWKVGCLYGFMYFPYLLSFQYLDAYQVGLLTLSTSLYICLIGDIVNKKINLNSYIYALISILGSYIILYKTHPWKSCISGVLLVETAGICFAYAQITYKSIKHQFPELQDTQAFAHIHLVSALITLIPAILFTNLNTIFTINLGQWSTLIYLGCIATGLAFYLWNKGSISANIATIAVANNLKIPLMALFSLFIFKEVQDPLKLVIGSLCIGIPLLLSESKLIKRTYSKI